MMAQAWHGFDSASNLPVRFQGPALTTPGTTQGNSGCCSTLPVRDTGCMNTALVEADAWIGRLERPASRGTSGLCRALAAHFGVDLLLIRISTAVLAAFTGLGLVLYLWGTALTGQDGRPAPMTRLAPWFMRWDPATRWITVAGTSLVVALLWQTGPLTSLMSAVVVLVTLTLARSESVGRAPSTTPAHSPDSDLPLVALYDSDPASPAVSRSWTLGLVSLAAGLTAASLVMVMGWTPVWTLTGLAGAAATGVALLVSALVTRTRRVPGLVLACVAVLSVHPVAATMTSATPQRFTPVQHSRELDYISTHALVDLSEYRDGTVEVSVLASSIDVILPEDYTLEVDETFSDVNVPEGTGSGVHIVIDAVASSVTGEHP